MRGGGPWKHPGNLTFPVRSGYSAGRPESACLSTASGRSGAAGPEAPNGANAAFPQRPLNSAFRFSRKADIPSFISSVEASSPKRVDSKSNPSRMAVSTPR